MTDDQKPDDPLGSLPDPKSLPRRRKPAKKRPRCQPHADQSEERQRLIGADEEQVARFASIAGLKGPEGLPQVPRGENWDDQASWARILSKCMEWAATCWPNIPEGDREAFLRRLAEHEPRVNLDSKTNKTAAAIAADDLPKGIST